MASAEIERKRLEAAIKRTEALCCDIELKILSKQEEIDRIYAEIAEAESTLLEKQNLIRQMREEFEKLSNK